MIDFDNIRAMADITRRQAVVMPEEIAQVFEERETSFRELDVRANRVAQGLIAEGCRKDARIGFMGKGSDRYFEMLHGTFKMGGVVVGVNWRLAPPEVAYVLNDSRTEVLFAGAEFYDTVDKVLAECPSVRRVIALDGGRPDWISFDEWRDGFPPEDPMLATEPDDDVIQLYTSGTTGHPKGVQLTNRNFFSMFHQAVDADAGWANWHQGEVALVCMPLFHVAGVDMGVLGNVQGCKNVIMKDVDPQQILDFIEFYRINVALMVPAVILFVLQQPNVGEADFSSMRQIIYGASPIAEDLLRQAQDVFQCDLIQVYGLTETTGSVVHLSPDCHAPSRGKLRSCGKPNPGVEVRTVDADGKDVPAGQVGEIILRSDCVMKGYWNRPEATAEVVQDGWFRTGDAGYFDEEGFLYIHDRVKDMIVSGAENIYPAEVENALFGHPDIADVAVVGVPDLRWGEAVKSIVVLKPGVTVTGPEIIAWVRDRIAGYKVPKSVDFIDALPRNPSGKILRRELREPYWEGHDRRVG